MSRFYLTLLFCLGSMHILCAQAVQFEKSYDINFNDRLYDFITMPDDGFLLVGETQLNTSDTKILLIRTDATGDTLWTKVLGEDLPSTGRRIIQLADGNYLIAGAYQGQAAVQKINAQGELLWVLVFPESNAGGLCKDVVETENKELIITRIIYLLPESSVLFRTDTLGAIAWEFEEGGTNFSQLNFDENMDLILSGSRANCFEPCMVQGKYHAAGIPFYVHDYDDFNGLGYCHTLLAGSGSYIGGQEMNEYTSTATLLHVDAEGEVVWKKNFTGNNVVSALAHDGTHLFATTYRNGKMDLMLLSTAGDSLGGMHFQQYAEQDCQKARVYGNSLCLAGYNFNWSDGGKNAWFININIDSISVAVGNTLEAESSSVLAYPNPSSGELSIRVQDIVLASIVAVAVFDPLGQLLQTIPYPDDTTITFDLSSYTAGVYFVKVQFKDQSHQCIRCLLR